MASSSVSQDDIDTTFEKNSRRTRIRAARARQINPVASSSQQGQNSSSSNNVPGSSGNNPGMAGSSSGGYRFDGSALEEMIACEEAKHQDQVNGTAAVDQESKANASSTGTAGGGTQSRITTGSSGPTLTTATKDGMGMKQRQAKINMHHVNKGKQQRDRRKLREKRRSTGVVHLASTESTTGGSTTGDEDESSDVSLPNPVMTTASSSSNAPASSIHEATKRNTQLNEMHGHHFHSHHHGDGHHGSSSAYHGKGHHHAYHRSSAAATGYGESSNAGNVSHAMHNLHVCLHKKTSSAMRHKSTSDLEADDENDQDSLNPSEESSSAFSSTNHLAGSSPPPPPSTTVLKPSGQSGHQSGFPRPGTPTGELIPEQIDRVLQENRRLLSLMEEKDHRIQVLEHQVQQLMKDTLSKNEEKSRLQKENSTLVRALANLTSSKNDGNAVRD